MLGEWLPDSALTCNSTLVGACLAAVGSLRAKLDLSFSGVEASWVFLPQEVLWLWGRLRWSWEESLLLWAGVGHEVAGYPFPSQSSLHSNTSQVLPPPPPPATSSNQPDIDQTGCPGAQSNLHVPWSWLYLPEPLVLGSGWALHQARSPSTAYKGEGETSARFKTQARRGKCRKNWNDKVFELMLSWLSPRGPALRFTGSWWKS